MLIINQKRGFKVFVSVSIFVGCLIAGGYSAAAGKSTVPSAADHQTRATQSKLGSKPDATAKTFSANTASDRILVRFKDTTSPGQVTNRIAASGVRTIKRFKSLSGLYLVQVPAGRSVSQVLAAYQNDPNVLYAEPDYVITPYFTPNDPSFPELWALHNTGSTPAIPDADINAPEAWDITQGSDTVVVAVIDTGIDYTHEDLIDNIWVNPNEIPGNNIDDDRNGYVDDIHGIDAVNNDSNPMDDIDHGTHVAGTIAARGNNALGVAGVSWNTKVIACKIFANSLLTLKGVVSDAIECLDYIYDLKVNHNINVIATNNSWGWIGSRSKALEDAISRQADAGILFVAAAGNNFASNDFVDNFPSNYYQPNVISVAASTSADDLAFFSNYGLRTVHVAAPGDEILSTVPGMTEPPIQNPFNSVYFNDVEGDQSQWQADSPWTTSNNAAYSGSLSWMDSPDGPYENNLDISLNSPTLDLSGASAQLYLGFYARYDLETGWDYLRVEISADNGNNWQTLDAITGYNFNWALHYYLIPTTAQTSQFKFRFRLVTDNIVTSDGISIDDIGIGMLPDGVVLSSNQYATHSGTSMAAPHATGLLSLLKAQDPGRDWRQLKNLLIAGGTPIDTMADATVSGRRLRAADADGTGSLTCNNQRVIQRLKPLRDWVEVSTSALLGVSMLHINCGQPAGELTVSISETGSRITLRDNGQGFDQRAGDGIYSAQIKVSDHGDDFITLMFPDDSTVIARAFNDYKYSEATYRWRNMGNNANRLNVATGLLNTIDLPFAIPFADKSGKYNAVAVADSGYVILHDTQAPTAGLPAVDNQLLPFSPYSDFFGLGNIVAPFWDDLMVTGDAGIYWAILGGAPNRELVIEWRNLTHFEYGGNVTFQVVFRENSSDIVFNYQDVIFDDVAADHGASATVGIQTTATSATTFSFYTPVIRNDQSLLWRTDANRNESGGGGLGWSMLVVLFLVLWRGYFHGAFSRDC